MAEASSSGTTKMAASSTDEDMDVDFEIDDEPPRIVPRSKLLESIAPNLGDDSAAMQQLYNDLEESKYNAFLRDSALGLILNNKYQDALMRLKEMEPRQQDRLYETFLMLECVLHLEEKYKIHLKRIKDPLLLSRDIECKEILQWGNNLASTKNPLMGWMYLFDIARSKKLRESRDLNEYAEWILFPAHEFGLKFHHMLLYMDQYDRAAKKVFGVTLMKWHTTTRTVSDKSRKYMAEFQIETSILLCKCILDLDPLLLSSVYAHKDDFKSPKYEDEKLKQRKSEEEKLKEKSVHKVYCFAITAAAASVIRETADLSDLKMGKKLCEGGVKAGEEAVDFVSDEEKIAALDILYKLQRDVTRFIRKKS